MLLAFAYRSLLTHNATPSSFPFKEISALSPTSKRLVLRNVWNIWHCSLPFQFDENSNAFDMIKMVCPPLRLKVGRLIILFLVSGFPAIRLALFRM